MNVLQTERQLYQDVWQSIDQYGTFAPGEHYLPLFLQMVGERRGTVLDAGTGSGKGALALMAAGFKVLACDVTDAGLYDSGPITFRLACLWHDLSFLLNAARHVGSPHGRTTFDYVYCTDVLEHIPPQFTMLAVDQMLRVTKHGLFLTVSLGPDSFGVWVGQALHQTVQSFTWWRDSLKELGTVVEARDLMVNAAFLVVPK